MAITIVQNVEGHVTDTAVTFALTGIASTGAGALIALVINNFGTRTVSSVTDNLGTNTYVQATSAAGTSGIRECDVWYCLSANAGITSVTATYSGSVTTSFQKTIWAYEVSGFITVAFDLASNITSGTGVSNVDTGASITTTGTTGFIVAACAPSGAVNANPLGGNEFTSGGSIEGNNLSAACSLISSTAAAHQPQWGDTAASSSFCSSTAAFKETGTAALPPDQDLWQNPVPSKTAEAIITIWQ